MKFADCWIIIGFLMTFEFSCSAGKNLRKRRQADFFFPGEYDTGPPSEEFGLQDDFREGFQNPFFGQNQLGPPQQQQQQQNQRQRQQQRQQQQRPQQQRQQQQRQQQQRGPQQQQQPLTRVPFPTPILPGPPANIDTVVQTTTVVPDTVRTTSSPSFLNCVANCPTTSEYNPICGTNYELYFNQQKFDCALKCGARVQVWRRGSCMGLFNMMRG